MENRMLIDSEWRWMAPLRQTLVPLNMCECGERKAVAELNGQRFCKQCAIESGEFEGEDLE